MESKCLQYVSIVSRLNTYLPVCQTNFLFVSVADLEGYFQGVKLFTISRLFLSHFTTGFIHFQSFSLHSQGQPLP
jgi:hypothetical protein